MGESDKNDRGEVGGKEIEGETYRERGRGAERETKGTKKKRNGKRKFNREKERRTEKRKYIQFGDL